MQFQAVIECPECGSGDITPVPFQGRRGDVEFKVTCRLCDAQWIQRMHRISPECREMAQKYKEHAKTSPTETILVDALWMGIFCDALGTE